MYLNVFEQNWFLIETLIRHSGFSVFHFFFPICFLYFSWADLRLILKIAYKHLSSKYIQTTPLIQVGPDKQIMLL